MKKALEKLRARLKELAGTLKTLHEKSEAGTDFTAEDFATLKSTNEEFKATEAQIKDIEDAESAQARAALPANNRVDDDEGQRPAAQAKQKLDAVDRIGIIALGLARTKREFGSAGHRNLQQVLDENGFGEIARSLDSTRKKALNSAAATQGGILVPDFVDNEVIDLLRPVTTFLQGNPRRVPMPNGTYKVPAAATGSRAAYRGETKPKVVTQPTFKALSMSAKLLAGIVPISDQLIRWSGPDIRAWVENDLRLALAQALDVAAYRGDGTEYTPLGLFNIPGIFRLAASGGTAPTIAQIEQNAASLELAMDNVNLMQINREWRMSPTLLSYLQNLRDGLGNRYFPELTPTSVGGQIVWRNKVVRQSTNMPNNLGVTTDSMELALIDFGYVYFGETLGMQLAVSNEATVVDGDGNQLNAFQDNLTLIRAETEHDIDVVHPEAVAVLDGIRWGR